jgi:hypothetical protein
LVHRVWCSEVFLFSPSFFVLFDLGLPILMMCIVCPVRDGIFGICPCFRLRVCVGTYLYHGTVCHNTSIVVGYLLSKLCSHFVFAKILAFPYYPFLWLV